MEGEMTAPEQTETQTTTTPKKRKKWPILIVALLVVFLAAAGGVYWYVLGTPQYSMYQLQAAYAQNDVEQAQKYVDIDAVSDQVVDVVVDEVKEQAEAATEEGGLLGGVELNGGLLDLLMPQIKSQAKEEFEDNFVASVAGEEGGETPFSTFGDEASEASFEQVDNEYLVTVSHPDEQFDVVFRLAQSDDRSWRIIAIDNLGDVLDEVLSTQGF